MSVDILRFKQFVQRYWFPFASNTQFVESGVKEAKLVSMDKRKENTRSEYAIIRSHTVSTYMDKARKLHEGVPRKVNHYRIQKRMNHINEEEEVKNVWYPRGKKQIKIIL